MGEGRVYHVAAYERLSREDGDRQDSDSILHQRRLLEEFCLQAPDLVLVSHYTDDGFTGTHFHRPAFQQMLRDIQAGVVNCVAVKDLSRFGRDYIDTGAYLERWFPAHRVRFIAVSDGIDSARGAYDLMLPVKNVFNAQFARDTSMKVRTIFAQKMSRGEFIGAFAPFGYQKDPQDSDRLLIDPAAAQVVQRIYALFLSGTPKTAIAAQLNQEGIPCPLEYKRLTGSRYQNGRHTGGTALWQYTTIRSILENPVYAGDMAQGRFRRPAMHAPQQALAPEDWVVVPNTHPALISREQWDRVQQLLVRRGRGTSPSGPVALFSGFLVCADCEKSMTRRTGRSHSCYLCGSYRRMGRAACSPHRIQEDDLSALILEDLNQVLSQVADLPGLACRLGPHQRQTSGGQRGAGHLSAARERLLHLQQRLYEDYREDLLSKEEYLRFRGDYTQRLNALDHLDAPPPPQTNYWVNDLCQRGILTQLDRLTLAEILEQIRVSENGEVSIRYRFQSPDPNRK